MAVIRLKMFWSVTQQIMVETKRTRIGREVIFEAGGNALRPTRSELAQWLGPTAVGRDPVDYAIRTLGFVRVRMVRSALVVEFQPSIASPWAVIAAYYEIADRAPNRIVLACRGSPDRFEIFCNAMRACQRIEELTKPNS
jgi:hypothetical protein